MKKNNSTVNNKNTVDKNSATSVTTIKTKEKMCYTEFFIINLLCTLLFIAFGYIAIMSFLETSKLDPANYIGEHIIYVQDTFILNFIFTILFLAGMFKLNKHHNFFEKIDISYMEVGLFAYTTLLGFFWIFKVTSIPAADSANIFETSTQAAQGIYNTFFNNSEFYHSSMYDGIAYFNCYPFQLGFVFICEIVYRIFGTDSSMPVQVLNVLCLSAGYLALAKISRLAFNRKKIEFITIMFLLGCFQPILFCTFVYGNIIGLCCALWASYFLIRYFKENKYILLLPCAILLIVSVMAKYNNLIYLVAFSTMLLIHTIKYKKWQSLVFAVALCVAVLGSNNLIVMSYEHRANTEIDKGVSQSLYLNMGLHDSSMAPGWYNGMALELYKQCYGKPDDAKAIAKSQIKSRIEEFKSNSDDALEFFSKKILSQWNEPTYESIWISSVKTHTNEIGDFVTSVYNKSVGQFLEIYFNFYMQILFLLFTIGIFLMIINEKGNICTMLLPLALLGGFGYHLLFEAKSQYILTYIILLIPTVSYCLCTIVEGKHKKIKSVIKYLKHIPNETI